MTEADHSQQIQELFLLQRVAQRINGILDLEVLLEDIVDDVARTFGYSRSAVLLKDDATNTLEIAAVRGWTTNYHLKGQRFKIGEYGMVGHVGQTEETYYAPDVTVDPYYRVSESRTRSELDIPLKVRGRLIGVFNAQHDQVNAFSPPRIQLLEALAGHVAVAIENAQLFDRERQEKERMIREAQEAQTIQAGLFPREAPTVMGFRIAGTCLPCRAVGGDWYDYIALDDGRIGIVLGDVSGKGMAAALLMSSTRSVLRLITENESSPAVVLSRLNQVLLKDFPAARFVTLIYAVLDPRQRTVVFANAGHPYPLLIDGAGARFVEHDVGLPLGIRDGAFSEHVVPMHETSRLLLYSDGVTETMNPSSEMYGGDRLRQHASARAASIPMLLREIAQFAGGSPAPDDVTVVMAEAMKRADVPGDRPS